MTDLSASAEDHIEQLRLLQERLSQQNAAIFEHRYNLLLMGSFSLVAGTAQHRIKFDWDGREFFLNVQMCDCKSQASTQEWVQVDNVRIAPPQSVWPVISARCGHALGA